jgi:integrase
MPNALKRIVDACDAIKLEWKNETGLGVWTGEDVKDLIWLMLYTGFRISDAAFFSSKRLQGDQVFIRAKKNGGDVFAYIPDWLRDRLLARAARFGDRPFIIARSERLETVTNIWRRRIAKAFEVAGPFEEPATPHRFRHTFARILLQRGVPVVAGELADPQHPGNQDGAVRAALPSSHRTADWDRTARMSGSHAVLDSR